MTTLRKENVVMAQMRNYPKQLGIENNTNTPAPAIIQYKVCPFLGFPSLTFSAVEIKGNIITPIIIAAINPKRAPSTSPDISGKFFFIF